MRAILLAFLLFPLSSCSREDIRVYRASKEAVRPPVSQGLHWDAPKTWRELPASNMRLASYEASGSVDISVVTLPGDAGGELANINRWRGQIGLEPWDEKTFLSNFGRIQSHAGAAVFVDFTGKQRLLAAILTHRGSCWFFKAMGDKKTVGKIRSEFVKFVEGVHEAH